MPDFFAAFGVLVALGGTVGGILLGTYLLQKAKTDISAWYWRRRIELRDRSGQYRD